MGFGCRLSRSFIAADVDVGDGDGAQAEQASNVTTSYWKKRYKAFIQRLKDAYAAAFPSEIGRAHV